MSLTVPGILHAAASRSMRFFIVSVLLPSGIVRWVAVWSSDALVSVIWSDGRRVVT
jgi:hypothetical protein